jgi:protein SCO1
MLDQPRPTSDFTLQSSDGGAPMSLSDFRGQYVLLYFGYTYCPDVCPLTMNDLAAMAGELGERRMENVQVIFISVDPDRDTPEHLASYLPHFHPDFLGMTGAVEDIQPVASQFGIFFQSHGGPGEGGYLVDHTSSVTLIDPQGRVRMVFPYGVSGAEMAQDLRYLMRTSFRF